MARSSHLSVRLDGARLQWRKISTGIRCQEAVLALETTIFTSPEIDWDQANLSLKKQVDLRHFLRAQQHFLANDDKGNDLLTRYGKI